MIEDQIKDICKKLKPVLGAQADQLWMNYLTSEDHQSKQEAASFIQMCAVRYLSDQVDDGTIYLPPPSRENTYGEIQLGRIYYGTRPMYPLYLTRDNFRKHMGIFSITGGGKTNIGLNLLLNFLRRNIPFLVIDWKRSYRSILALDQPKVKTVQILTVGRKTNASFHWNPLRGPPKVNPRTWINVVVETLEKSHISGQGVADILIDVLDDRFETMGVYDGSFEHYPNFFDIAQELVKLKVKGRRMLWHDSSQRIVRTFTFGPAAGTFNARHPSKLEEFLEKPVIFELDQELPKPLRVFFSEIILRWIHLYRLGQGETDNLRHVAILEEVHNMFPKTRIEHQVTNSLENIFREIRSFGQGLITITQHPSLLPIYVLGNCNTQIYLGLQHEDDIITAKRALFLEPRDEVYLDRLKVGEGIVKIKGRIHPCHVRFPHIKIKPGVITDSMLGGENNAKTPMGPFRDR